MDGRGGRGTTGEAAGVRSRATLGWAVCLATVTMVGATLMIDVFLLRPDTASRQAGHYAYLTLAVPLAVAGALITARRPGNRIGVLMLIEGVTIAGDQFSRDYLLYCRDHQLPTVWILGWLC